MMGRLARLATGKFGVCSAFGGVDEARYARPAVLLERCGARETSWPNYPYRVSLSLGMRRTGSVAASDRLLTG